MEKKSSPVADPVRHRKGCFPAGMRHRRRLVTHARDRNFQTGIVGSIAIHLVVLILLTWGLGSKAGRDFLREQELKKKAEPEVTLIFPEQVIVLPPPEVKPKPKVFIRTSQNEESNVKPKNPAFISDRNTIAASESPPVPGALAPMPTLTGTAPDIRELVNRDYKDGEIKNDSAPTSLPQPTTPPSILKPQQSPPTPPPQPQVAQAKPAPTPLTKMMEEMDQQEKEDKNKDRLPLEVRKPEPPTPPVEAPSPAPAIAPQVRVPEDMPPLMKMPTVDDPVTRKTKNPEKDSMSPFTRTSKTEGSISREGENAVDAEATPEGKYMRQVVGAIEKKWGLYVRLGKDSLIPGSVQVRFFVDKKGTAQDLRILSKASDADPRTRELILRVVLDAQIPPIPPEVLSTLEDGRMKIEYEFIIY